VRRLPKIFWNDAVEDKLRLQLFNDAISLGLGRGAAPLL
jgi:hypothetical protein